MAPSKPETPLDVACVAIGRNEGERLRRCLNSVKDRVRSAVYVDSNSTDDSVAFAESIGVDVVQLDMSIPFTAARARNAGFERVRAMTPDVRYVQFVDGDCEVVDGWLETASRVLDEQSDVAIVCGRRRERHPDASIYNRLCDLEWDTPVGETEACGGDFMIRREVMESVGGLNPELIAGEEPEFCLRVRRGGWRILRLDHEMTLHDAAMTSVKQWWKRAVRWGHACAEGAHMHGDAPEQFWVSEARRAVLWGGVVPAMAIGGVVPTFGTSLLLLGGYPLNAARTFRRSIADGRSTSDAALYAASCTLQKFPEFQGLVRFHVGRWAGNRSKIIEYKE
ncbi:MAG: glycosyltransferase [Myxococcota bacterium]